MNKRVSGGAKTPFLSANNPEGVSNRRMAIANALDRCIRETGYAATTLTDIAVGAAMSPSHIRYYFDGKAEILEFYLETVCDQIIRDISALARRTPAQWLDDLTAYLFTNPALTGASVAALIEAFAASSHNPRLARVKAKYDDFIRKTFLEFFRWAGCANGISAADAAYTGWILDIGMKFNAGFQKDFSRDKASKIFLGEMRRMSGLTGPVAKR